MNASTSFLTLLAAGICLSAPAGDQPQWGEAWSRNMVSREKNLPDSFDPNTGRNLKWKVRLGTESYSTPVVAGGKIYIGTNNGEPRDPKHKGDRGVLMCLDEKDGHLLWQLVSPKREEDPYMDWPNTGLSSPATVEGNRVYIVSNRGEVLCLDANGLADGNQGPYLDESRQMTPKEKPPGPSGKTDSVEKTPGTGAPARPEPVKPDALDADIIWLCNLTSEAGIWSHDGAHSSILIQGDYLYLNSGTGVDNTHKKIRTPDAPSLVVIDKRTGKLIARDDEKIAPDIFHCTWSPPSLGAVNGRPLLFFAAGNGIVYGFETLPPRSGSASGTAPLEKLKKVFQFDFDPTAPKENVHKYSTNRREGPSNIYGMPVFHDGKIYVAGGGDPFWGKTEAWLKCIDATKGGDVTKSAEVWRYRLERHVMSTPAVQDGLVFIADWGKKLHCLDAATGKAYWTHDMEGEVWASPMVVDGKVYIGTRHGDFWVLAAAKEKKVLSSVELVNPISATATAANGTLYIGTMTELFAVASGARRN